MRSGYLIIARMLSSSPSAFAARSKFSSATSYAFIGFVAVANMANLNSEFSDSAKSFPAEWYPQIRHHVKGVLWLNRFGDTTDGGVYPAGQTLVYEEAPGRATGGVSAV